VVAYRGGAPVHLSDVADTVDDAENLRQAAWMNDQPAVIVNIQRQPGANFIPSIAVPVSIIGTFAVMYGLGFSLNNLSLMALTIATGFVVDDAVVMIENIARYIEAGDA